MILILALDLRVLITCIVRNSKAMEIKGFSSVLAFYTYTAANESTIPGHKDFLLKCFQSNTLVFPLHNYVKQQYLVHKSTIYQPRPQGAFPCLQSILENMYWS